MGIYHHYYNSIQLHRDVYFFHRNFLVNFDISLSSHQFFAFSSPEDFHAECVNEYMLSLILPATSRSARETIAGEISQRRNPLR